VRTVAAEIDYLAGLSPVALPNGLVMWPEPEDRLLVREDDESTRRRRRAAAAFARLAEERPDVPAVRRRAEVWRLACLATDPESQEAAAAYATALLESDPRHVAVVPWVRHQGYAVDLAPVETMLLAGVDDGSAGVPE